MNRISSNYEENVQWFNDVLGAGRSCDMVCRDLYVGGRRARFWVIDGFGGDAILERMGAFWLSLQPEAVQGLTEMQQFADRYVTFMEVNEDTLERVQAAAADAGRKVPTKLV